MEINWVEIDETSWEGYIGNERLFYLEFESDWILHENVDDDLVPEETRWSTYEEALERAETLVEEWYDL